MTPDTKVAIAFDLSVSGAGDFFTLNDSVKGELDNVTYVLAGDILTDVTEDVRSVTLRRGRSQQLDKVQAGQANVVLSNVERKYDPANGLAIGTRENLLPNPSFEVDTSGWSASSSALTDGSPNGSASISRIATGLFGSHSLQVDTDPADPPPPVVTNYSFGTHTILSLEANTTYVISGYVFPILGNPVELAAKDTTNNITSVPVESDAPSGGFTPASFNDWQRLSTLLTTGASPAQVEIAFRVFIIDSKNNPAYYGLSRFYLDGVLVEEASTLEPYFDGSVASGEILIPTVSWSGTAHDSTSNLSYGIPGTGSPYFPSIKPRKEIQVTINDSPVFTGIVEDWDYQYSVNGDSTAMVRAADGFARLAQSTITPVAVPSETSGERIERVLDLSDVAWPSTLRDLDVGSASLASGSIGGGTDLVNALQYLQRVEADEAGVLFVDGSGLLTFRSRVAAKNVKPVTFSDVPGGVPFTDISVDYGTETVRNVTIVTREDGSRVTATDTVSVAEYGVISYEINDSLLLDDPEATDLAQYIVSLYGQPKVRIDSITVDLKALTVSDRFNVLGLELGDVVRVSWTPQGVGLPISKFVQVDSIEHSITPGQHLFTLELSDASVDVPYDSLTVPYDGANTPYGSLFDVGA